MFDGGASGTFGLQEVIPSPPSAVSPRVFLTVVPSSPLPRETSATGLAGAFCDLWAEMRPAFKQRRTWERAGLLTLSGLASLGRHTITGLLCTSGQQFDDWTAAYRLFSEQNRIDMDRLFTGVRRAALEWLEEGAPVFGVIDDSLIHKTGRTIPGTAWRRDSQGPRFQCNLIWGQRVLQVSLALPWGPGPSPAQLVPVDFVHAPTAKRPGKRGSSEAWETYRKERKALCLGVQASERLAALRQGLDGDPRGQGRPLIISGDGGYTNRAVLKHLPARTTFIGRIRKDAKLYHPAPPPEQGQKGRRRLYGERAPTPESVRQDESVSWIQVRVWAAGKIHAFQVKSLIPVLWRAAGAHQPLRLIVIRPLAYRKTPGGRVLYRDPVYLICTDPNLPLETLLQAYVWRWGIEVNFRDEKTLLGIGEAQVRHDLSIESLPAFRVAGYSLLQLAARRAFGPTRIGPNTPSPPKWRQREGTLPLTTQRMLSRLRAELWGDRLGLSHFSGFTPHTPKPQKFPPPLASAVIYASG